MLHLYPVASLFLEYWPSYWEKSGLERRASQLRGFLSETNDTLTAKINILPSFPPSLPSAHLLGGERPKEGCPFAQCVKAGGEIESRQRQGKLEICQVCLPRSRQGLGAGQGERKRLHS